MAVDDKALLFAGSTGQLIVLLRPAGGLAEIGLFSRRPEQEGCSATRPFAGWPTELLATRLLAAELGKSRQV